MSSVASGPRVERDGLGRTLRLARVPERIVSLVPSFTETLFCLGTGGRVVGVTEFCVHPAEALEGVTRVGGTKNASVEAILNLRPELVIANKEENRRKHVAQLEEAGVPVWVGDARSVESAVAEIRALGRLCGAAGAANALSDEIEAALQQAPRSSVRPRCLALIWKNPYMAVGTDTFAHDLLRCSGADNALAGDSAENASRYPRLDSKQIEALNPDVILLPTEPYEFAPSDRAELLALDCSAARGSRVYIIEGELLTWYGPRIVRALQLLSELFSEPPRGHA